mmetsp:Transcript_28084/g.47257  ORF Transcript_28084/g.47257 Transcript_28084/m.47257 type:complete len:232 (+) Transcript_28084:221-916(+)
MSRSCSRLRPFSPSPCLMTAASLVQVQVGAEVVVSQVFLRGICGHTSAAASIAALSGAPRRVGGCTALPLRGRWCARSPCRRWARWLPIQTALCGWRHRGPGVCSSSNSRRRSQAWGVWGPWVEEAPWIWMETTVALDLILCIHYGEGGTIIIIMLIITMMLLVVVAMHPSWLLMTTISPPRPTPTIKPLDPQQPPPPAVGPAKPSPKLGSKPCAKARRLLQLRRPAGKGD